MLNLNYQNTKFIMSAPNINKLPLDNGLEVAFVGVSNSGKSSLINALCQQNSLAKTSSTPGRTQLINLFAVAPFCNIVDLPGYGYAAVPEKLKIAWQKSLGNYLEKRQYLAGIVLLMDSRHPLKPLDIQMLDWANQFGVPIVVALTKIDKLTQQQYMLTLNKVSEALVTYVVASEDNPEPEAIPVIPCSAVKKRGINKLAEQLDKWFEPVTSKYEELGVTSLQPSTEAFVTAELDVVTDNLPDHVNDNYQEDDADGILARNIASPRTKGYSNKQRYSPTAKRLGTAKPFDPSKLNKKPKQKKNNPNAKKNQGKYRTNSKPKVT